MFGEDQRKITNSKAADTVSRTIVSAALCVFVFYRFETDVAAAIAIATMLLGITTDEVNSNIDLAIGNQYRRLWHSELTTRIAIISILNGVRDGSKIDPDLIFKNATTQAAEDIKLADADYEEARSMGLALKHSLISSIFGSLLGYATVLGASSGLGIYLRTVLKL